MDLSFYICTSIELEITIVVICNCLFDETIPDSIQWPNLSMELEVPPVGPDILYEFFEKGNDWK